MLFSFILAFSACKNEAKTQAKKKEKLNFSDSIVASGRVAVENPESAEQLTAYRGQAKSIVEYRIKQKPKSWAILDVGVWEYEFVYKDGEMSKTGAYKGRWIDFDDKNNYQYGFYDAVEGKGRYHYDNETHMLLLADEIKQPQEFEVKLVNEMMILMGRNSFGTNATQAKLIKVNNIPSKK